MHERWEKAEGEELIELLELFDVRISYDNQEKTWTWACCSTLTFPTRPMRRNWRLVTGF